MKKFLLIFSMISAFGIVVTSSSISYSEGITNSTSINNDKENKARKLKKQCCIKSDNIASQKSLSTEKTTCCTKK